MNNPHQNARTTVYSRELIVKRVLKESNSVTEVARQLGISRRTVYKWLARYRQYGPSGLENHGSRPHRSPKRLAVRKVAVIAAMRRMGRSGPAIAFSLSLPVSSVSLELRRLGLGKAARLEPRPQVVRYEHEEPGAMVHLDTKKLGKIGMIGHRIHGDRTRCQRGVGWEFLHVCIDDHSRLAYSEVLADERGVTVAGFLLRAADWLARHGVKMRRVMTDNGSGYVSRAFRAAVVGLGARHVRTRPYTPRTNGKAERFIQTSLREWAYCQAYETSYERTEMLGPWLHYYNNLRPHTALNYKPPVSRLINCEQRPC